jgi:hypothetical protein
MVMAVWLTLNVSADGTGLLERRGLAVRPMPRRDSSAGSTNAPAVSCRIDEL